MKISVVIPALDEADHIEAAIRAAADTRDAPEPGPDPAVEIIVVDGGSRDGTDRIAAAAGARVLRSATGRARQLELGFRDSRGDVLLFLHADTRLPRGWSGAIRSALRDERVVGGAFRFRFDDRSVALRWIEWGATLRSVLFGWPYGDQALFVRRGTLEAMGGVPQVPWMEDLDLVREMKRHGRLALLPLPAVTSARRYRASGPVCTWLRHVTAAVGWALGIDRTRLARWVRR